MKYCLKFTIRDKIATIPNTYFFCGHDFSKGKRICTERLLASCKKNWCCTFYYSMRRENYFVLFCFVLLRKFSFLIDVMPYFLSSKIDDEVTTPKRIL